MSSNRKSEPELALEHERRSLLSRTKSSELQFEFSRRLIRFLTAAQSLENTHVELIIERFARGASLEFFIPETK